MYIMPLTYLYFTYIFLTCSKAIGLIAKTYSYISVKKEGGLRCPEPPSLCAAMLILTCCFPAGSESLKSVLTDLRLPLPGFLHGLLRFIKNLIHCVPAKHSALDARRHMRDIDQCACLLQAPSCSSSVIWPLIMRRKMSESLLASASVFPITRSSIISADA